MEAAVFLLFFVVVLVIAVVASQAARRAEEARQAALFAFAQENGLTFHPGALLDRVPSSGFWNSLFADSKNSDEGRFLSRFEGFYPFGQGHSPEVRNLLYGHHSEHDWAIFDYSYKVTTSNGKSTTTTTHPFTLVVSRLPFSFSPLIIRPEGFFDRLSAKLGMQDLRFESDEFNRRYVVQADDPQAAYDLLHPQTMEMLLRATPRHWQISGRQIVMVRAGTADLTEVGKMMAEVDAFVRLIPGYVREDKATVSPPQSPF